MGSVVDLTARLGLPAELNLETGRISFGVSVGKEVTRILREVVESGVMHNADEIPARHLEKVVTIIYRFINDEEVRRIQRIDEDSDKGVKFDVTVLLPYVNLDQDWCWEFPKTIGHYHLTIRDLSIASPDFYQVVYGRGKLLLQKRVGKSVESCIVDPEVLEPVIVPPAFGHIAINVGDEPLVFANACVRQPHLDYASMVQLKGGTHYLLRKRGGRMQVLVNPEYSRHGYSIGKLIALQVNSPIPELGIEKGRPLYEYVHENGRASEMMCRPDKYAHIFSASLAPKVTT